MRLVRIIWHHDDKRLDVIVRDARNRLRKVDVYWSSEDVPPNWVELVKRELSLKDQKSASLPSLLGR